MPMQTLRIEDPRVAPAAGWLDGWLAAPMVELGETPRSPAEREALLRQPTRPVPA